MIKILSIALGVVLLSALLLGFLWQREKEARERATHDPIADSLARDTREETALLAQVDTVFERSHTIFRDVRLRVDTVPLTPEGRELVRACDRVVADCQLRRERADSLIAALRRELEHALDPPPGPRRSFFIRSDYDFLNKNLAAQAGAAYRLFGGDKGTKMEAYGGVGASQYLDSLQTKKTEPRLIVGGQLTFR